MESFRPEYCSLSVPLMGSAKRAQRNIKETLKALLRGRGVFYVDSAVFYAAHGGHADTVRTLLEAGALGHAVARREAGKNGHSEMARVLKNWRSNKRKKHATA